MYELISPFATQEILQFLKDNISLNIAPKELKKFTMYLVLLALPLLGINSYLTCFLLYAKPYANEQKCA